MKGPKCKLRGWILLKSSRYWLLVGENMIGFRSCGLGQICGFWAGVGWEAPWGGFGGGRQAEQLDQHCPLPPSTSHHPNSLSFPPNHYRKADEEENGIFWGCFDFFCTMCLSLWGGAVQSDMFTGDHPFTLLRWPALKPNLISSQSGSPTALVGL